MPPMIRRRPLQDGTDAPEMNGGGGSYGAVTGQVYDAPGAHSGSQGDASGPEFLPGHNKGWDTSSGNWTPSNHEQFQTGMYDPTNSKTQYDAQGRGVLGADNGANADNMWQGEYQSQLAAGQNAATRRAAAGDAKGAMNTAAGGMPGAYQPPSAWQAPGAMPAAYQRTPYVAPSAWQDPTAGKMPGSYAGNGPRSALPSAQDYAGDTSTLAAAVRGAGGATPVTADSVSGGGAAFKDYARGASNSMLSALKQQMASSTDTAAGRGRVGSGFYQQDTGTLARGLAGDSENNILSHALEAANLDQSAAVGNADRRLSAGEFSAGQGQTAALAGLSTAASTGQSRAALDQGDYSTDQTFGLNKQGQDYGQSADARNFSRSAYADDRGFGADQQQRDFTQGMTSQAQDYGQSADARNFSRSSYDDDRNFGSSQQQTNYGQAADARDYATGNYRYEDQAATGAGQYADNRLDANRSWVTNRDQNTVANKGPGIGGVIGGIAGTALGSLLGPVGAGLGGKIGSSLFGGGGGGQQTPYSYDAPQGIPGFTPQDGGGGGYGGGEEEDPFHMNGYNGWQL